MTNMSLKDVEDLGIDLSDLSGKRYVNCPKCGDERSKDSRSLGVFPNPPYINFECFHADQCEWNTGWSAYITDTDYTDKAGVAVNAVSEYTWPVPDDAPQLTVPGAMLFPYKDRQGKLRGYAVRVDGPDGKWTRPYSFNGSEWIQGWPAQRKDLFHAEHLDLRPEAPVLVVEGEKKAELAMKKLPEFVVVSAALGANNVHKGDWDLLASREVYLWPDNDAPGKKAMKVVAEMLPVASTLLYVDHLGEGEDIGDDLTAEQIEEAFAKATYLPIEIHGSRTVEELRQRRRERKGTAKWGFEAMDKHLPLPKTGLVAIEARTGHGKTSFMSALAKNQLEVSKRTVVFITYEMQDQEVHLKMMIAKDEKALPSVNHYLAELEEGTLLAEEWLNANINTRLFSLDACLTLQQIVDQLNSPKLKEAIVFVDHLQKIRAGDSTKEGFTFIKQCMETLEEVANRQNQLIFVGAMLTPSPKHPSLDVVREGKDIDNTACIVIRLWNKDAAEAAETVHPRFKDCLGNFFISVQKGRFGIPNTFFSFSFSLGAKFKPVYSFESTNERYGF